MDSNPVQATVILLHGISRTSRVMLKMADALTADGYSVLNIHYPSTSMSIEALAEWVYEKIKPYCDIDKPIHFVGHSMGAIIARLIIRDHRPENLGRAVMIAPPNKGSIVADFMQRFRFYEKWFGPAGQQIGTNHKGVHHQLPPADFECAVIAGDRTTDPWFSWFLHKDSNDGKVSVENTKLAGMKLHIVVHATHASLPKNKEVIQLVREFLSHGVFHLDAEKEWVCNDE